MAGVMAMMAQVEHLEATEHCRISLVDSTGPFAKSERWGG
jgi:hypothetical protein